MRHLIAAGTALAAVSVLACGGGGSRATPSPTSTPAATSTFAPAATLVSPTEEPGAAASIAAVRADLATRVGEVEVQHMDVILITRRDWPDSCLGLPRPTEQCSDVITPGYEIWLGTALGSAYAYRVAGPANVRFDRVLPTQ